MYDIITLGSATADVFVKTKGREIITHDHHQDVAFPIGGKILIDKIDFDTGGGGTNSATACARLGLRTGWVGKLGNDPNSKHIRDVLKKEKITFLGATGKGSTGYSVILTGLQKDRSILTSKGINNSLSPNEVKWNRLKTKWFYFSSMLGKSFKTLEKAAMHAKKNKIKYAFNPSSYLAKQGIKKLRKILDGCDLLVLNKEEAQTLLKRKISMQGMLKALQRHAKLVVITDGKKGACAYNGINTYKITPGKQKIVETTGAGDAFAAGVMAGLIIKKDLEYGLMLGQAEAEHVIMHIGAKEKLLTRKQANNWIKLKKFRLEVH